jgi:hypothetical protein
MPARYRVGMGASLKVTMATHWQDRIIEFGRKPANQFLANPQNARQHPPAQREALRGSLETIGNIGVILESVSGYLIDGHARVEEALSVDENMELAYVLVDLAPHEEAKALASYDFITSLATYEKDILDNLLRDVQTDDARVMATMSALAEMEGIIPPDFQPIGMDEQPRLDQLEPKWAICPHCGEKFDVRGNEA